MVFFILVMELAGEIVVLLVLVMELAGEIVVFFILVMELAGEIVVLLVLVMELAGELGKTTEVTMVTVMIFIGKRNSCGESSKHTNQEECLHCKDLLCCCMKSSSITPH